MFHMFLLIPNRIREIKEEGRAEGRKEGRAEALAEVFEEGRKAGRAEALAEARAKRREIGRREGQMLSDKSVEELKAGIRQGFEIGRKEEMERQRRLFAQYDRGEITLDELRAIYSGRPNGDNGAN